MPTFLITGIPGTGKTTIGNHLRDNRGFVHIDMEDDKTWPQELVILNGAIDDYISQLGKNSKSVVITWGFVPDYQGHIDAIANLISNGAKMIWFDGNRPAARKAFLVRGTVPESLLDIQLARIDKANIINMFKPKVLNTFDEDGNFLEKEEIIKLLLQ